MMVEQFSRTLLIHKSVPRHVETIVQLSQQKPVDRIEVGENYNLPKSENAKQPLCPVEKEKAIRDALEHFRMI